MGTIWNRPVKTIVLSMLVLLYIIMGLTILRKKPPDLDDRRSTETSDIKTFVGYSMQYRVSEELKHNYKCDNLVNVSVNVVQSVENVVKLFYDDRTNVFVLNAYWDLRLEPFFYVRIIAMLDISQTFYCQTWNEKMEIQEIRRGTISPIWSRDWDTEGNNTLIPALLNCLINEKEAENPPKYVSIVSNPCREPDVTYPVMSATQKQQVTNDSRSFIVCVKPVFLTKDIHNTLYDWVNFNTFFGASKIIFYHTSLNKNNFKILKKLQNVELKMFRSSRLLTVINSYHEKVWLKRKLEVLVYNDCFYRHLNDDFVIPMDVDEIIVPKTGNNWNDMFNYINNSKFENISSFSVKNAYFFRKYPQNALVYHDIKLPIKKGSNLVKNSSKNIFSRQFRSFRYSPNSESVKSFIFVSNTLSVFNHFTFEVLKPSVRQVILPVSVAQLNHYRDFCDTRLIENCDDYLYLVTNDNSLLRFNELMHSKLKKDS